MFYAKGGSLTARTDFRRDINGLRGWAVIVVICYHFGVPGFTGGFVGVDIFFVISGFLMTGIVVKSLETKQFSLWFFYYARAKRILPALLVMCIVLMSAGWFVLLPPDYKDLSTQVISSLGFFSNIKYWSEAGYFDIASHEKWLLHTWSLSVEWQFYLILPVVLWAVWQMKPGRKPQIWAVACALVLSLVACLITTDREPTKAFFFLHTRAWEMLAGGLVQLVAADSLVSKRLKPWCAHSGLLLIAASVTAFDVSASWPGWRACIPVVAASLVIMGNQNNIWVNNKISHWIGERSYSLYLWHWPIFVALVYIERSRDPVAIFFGLFMTMLLGHMSFRWIEMPTRQRLNTWQPFSSAAALLGTVSVAVGVGAAIRNQGGILGRFSPAVEQAAAEASNTNPRRKECHTNSGITSPSCVFGGEHLSVIAVGDSHVVTTISAIAKAQPLQKRGVVWWSYSGCVFVPGMKLIPVKQSKAGPDYNCTAFNNWILQQISLAPNTTPLVIVGRYASAAFGQSTGRSSGFLPQVYFSKIYTEPTLEFLDEFAMHIVKSVCLQAQSRPVYVVRPIPEMDVNVPKALSRRMAMGLVEDISVSLDQYFSRNSWVWAAQNIARDKCGVKILDPIPYLCSNGRCFGSRAGRPLYFDDNHLSEFGNELLIPMFEQLR